MGEYCLRLILALLCGALLGAERSFRFKDAGIRTHSILALTTCLFMILSKYAFFGDQGGADPAMIACQIVMGINFLGAGIIFRSGQMVSRGLTTAAGVWATAAIGMACGCGLIPHAIIFTLTVLALHLLIQRFDLDGSAYVPQELRLTVTNTPEIWQLLETLRVRYGIRILSSRYTRTGSDVFLILQVQMKTSIPLGDVIDLMDAHKEIKEFSI